MQVEGIGSNMQKEDRKHYASGMDTLKHVIRRDRQPYASRGMGSNIKEGGMGSNMQAGGISSSGWQHE